MDGKALLRRWRLRIVAFVAVRRPLDLPLFVCVSGPEFNPRDCPDPGIEPYWRPPEVIRPAVSATRIPQKG